MIPLHIDALESISVIDTITIRIVITEYAEITDIG